MAHGSSRCSAGQPDSRPDHCPDPNTIPDPEIKPGATFKSWTCAGDPAGGFDVDSPNGSIAVSEASTLASLARSPSGLGGGKGGAKGRVRGITCLVTRDTKARDEGDSHATLQFSARMRRGATLVRCL